MTGDKVRLPAHHPVPKLQGRRQEEIILGA